MIDSVHSPNAAVDSAPHTESTVRSAPRDPLADKLAAVLNAQSLPTGDFPPFRSVPVSVLIPVKNEQRNIEHCIRHLNWAQEVVVVDSQSTDQTIALSQAMGAAVFQFHFSPTGWPKKKNWAIENVPWQHEWLLIMDADEYCTPELAQEIRRIVTSDHPGADGFWINRRFMFMGRWIRHCGYYPSWNVRLFKHRVGRYERIGNLGNTGSGDNEVHEHVVLSTGEAKYLRHDFLHYAYPDLATWVEKHNRYSTWEAFAMNQKNEGEIRPRLFGGGPIARRRWIKRRVSILPFRPLLRFIYSYFLRGGILDGYAGFVMCRLLAWYEFISIAKQHEMKNNDPHGKSTT